MAYLLPCLFSLQRRSGPCSVLDQGLQGLYINSGKFEGKCGLGGMWFFSQVRKFAGKMCFSQVQKFGGMWFFSQVSKFGGMWFFSQVRKFGGMWFFSQVRKFGGMWFFSQVRKFGGMWFFSQVRKFAGKMCFSQVRKFWGKCGAFPRLVLGKMCFTQVRKNGCYGPWSLKVGEFHDNGLLISCRRGIKGGGGGGGHRQWMVMVKRKDFFFLHERLDCVNVDFVQTWKDNTSETHRQSSAEHSTQH